MNDPYRPAVDFPPPDPLAQVWVTMPKRRVWLHVLLFLLTVATTLAVGARLAHNFSANRPAYDMEHDWNPFSGVWQEPARLIDGLPFSATLLIILLVHEMGHYLMCVRYGIAASYPYFLPAPTIIGTMGAFIRIQSPIRTRRALFDIGVAGPLAGFVIAVPLLAAGVSLSVVLPPPPESAFGSSIHFGNPPLMILMQAIFHPGTASGSLSLHPIARAAWVGLFATALNLLPAGQLDGGHIVYALDRRWHRPVSRATVLVLGLPMLVIGASWLAGLRWPSALVIADAVEPYYWYGWFFWSAVLLFLGPRHPAIYDSTPLGSGRRRLALAALAVFLFCFTPTPFIL